MDLNVVVPLRRAQLLRSAAEHCDSEAEWLARKRRIDLDGFFGLHPSLGVIQAAVGFEAAGDRCTLPVRQTTRVRTLMRRTTWNRRRPA